MNARTRAYNALERFRGGDRSGEAADELASALEAALLLRRRWRVAIYTDGGWSEGYDDTIEVAEAIARHYYKRSWGPQRPWNLLVVQEWSETDHAYVERSRKEPRKRRGERAAAPPRGFV